MKILNAIWERRNLGLRVCEIVFEDEDGELDIARALEDSEFDYYVAKVTTTNIPLVHSLEKRGFRYLENQLSISFCTNEVNRIDKRWIDRFSEYNCTQLQNEEEFNHIIEKTIEGLFEKDRFSVDPLIDPSLPDRRIAAWIGDIYQRGESSIYLIKKDKIIKGFFILRSTQSASSYVEMAALFRDYRSSGLSFLLIYNILIKAASEGAKSITASVSTNNIRTINTFTRFINFRIGSLFIVLRRYKTGH